MTYRCITKNLHCNAIPRQIQRVIVNYTKDVLDLAITSLNKTPASRYTTVTIARLNYHFYRAKSFHATRHGVGILKTDTKKTGVQKRDWTPCSGFVNHQQPTSELGGTYMTI